MDTRTLKNISRTIPRQPLSVPTLADKARAARVLDRRQAVCSALPPRQGGSFNSAL